MLNTSVFLINISSISAELFSELLIDSEQKAQTFYEAWHDISYATSKTLVIIRAEDYVHIVDDKKVKSKKLIAKSKKMTVIDYRDSSIYCLYDRKKNEIIFFISVCLNEENMLTSSFSNKDSVIDKEFFNEFFNESFNKLSDKTDNEISMSIQSYIKSEHLPVREFVNMRKQQNAAKKKNKNKENNKEDNKERKDNDK